jgi:DNA-binding NarL/FixJ family response regulator
MTTTYYKTIGNQDVLVTRTSWSQEQMTELLQLISEGKLEYEAAKQLNRTSVGIKKCLVRLRTHYNVPNTTALIAKCIREGRI